MAGLFTHLIFANQIAANSSHAFESTQHLASFALGALATDSGYLQPKDSFSADLAHTVGSLQLARTVLHLADTPSDRAFALGWISHAILDRHSHPVINAHSGQVSGIDHPLTFADNAPLHSAVELGIDASWIRELPALPIAHFRKQIPSASHLLASAYRDTYGIEFPPSLFASNLNRLLQALSLLHRIYCWNRLDLFRSTPQTRSRWKAILFPMKPDPSFQEAMRQAIRSALDDYSDGLTHHFVHIPDINLDTGDIGFCDRSYPPAISTLNRLNAIRTNCGLQPLQAS